jgi:diguanylate cyclase (GGDEF)-like protein/PAS domain S-box-containing protein
MNLLNFVSEHPDIIVLIYKEKIVYCNRNFSKIYGKPCEEIIGKTDVIDLFPDEKKEIMTKIKERRLKGEKFTSYYSKEELITYDKKRLFVKFHSKTIDYEGTPAGLVIGVDVTHETKINFLLDLRQKLSRELMSSYDINDVFKYITHMAYQEGIFNFTCIPVKDPDSMHFTPKFYEGEYDSHLIKFFNSILYMQEDYLDKCYVTKYLLANQIALIKDVEDMKYEHLKKELLARNIRSAVCIPIYYEHNPIAIIGLFSEYKNDFDEKYIKTFEDLKNCVEFTISKIKILSNLLLIKEAIDKEHSWVVITDENGIILYANKTVEELSGYKISELIGKKPNVFKSGCHNQKFYEKLWNTIKKGKIFEYIIINKSKNGNLFYLHDKIIPVKTLDNKTYFISIGKDVTNEYKLKNEIKRFQKYDILTKLMNRNRFVEKISERLQIDKDGLYALLIIDIKDFKLINQLYGREKGDRLLVKIAEFLQNVTYNEDLISRIGSDEFAVFIKLDTLNTLYKIIDKIFKKIKNVDFYDTEIDINMGIALYPKDATDISELIEKALISLEVAKEKGENEFEVYNQQIHDNLLKEKNSKEIIKQAIKENEFVYHFQPYFDAKTLKPTGAESLIRISQKGHLIYPDKFIDFAEKSGFIKEIENIMFPKYLEYLAKSPIPLSFNISGTSMKDLTHIKNLFKNIDKNNNIIIELTERELAFNIEYTIKVFEFLKEKNIKIAIDDFGTGFSSLTYLKNLPIDILKIDMSFIKNIDTCNKDYAIVESVIDFAHKFKMKTVAEGVEREEQVKILQKLGCDYLQGFYFSKPLPFDKFISFLKNYQEK